MANWIATAPEARPALTTRERLPGKVEAQCPACNQWRPAFTIAPLDAADALLRGVEWACDGDRTRWEREG